MPIGQPQHASSQQPFALWSIGFRPLYLLAGLFAVITISCWTAQFAGWVGHVYLPNSLWHAHEMIFGYAFAVIVGFLFTAVRNWTDRSTPSGAVLAATVALWFAARVCVLADWPIIAAIADTAFAVSAAGGIAVPLIGSKSRRNYFFIALFLALGAVNLVFYLAMGGLIDFPVRRGLQVGLDLILFIIAVMGGRVIPMFTANAVPGAKPTRLKWLEHACLASVLALIAADLSGLSALGTGVITGFAGIAHAARLALWRPWFTVRRPILWILHVSYAWIVVHFALRSFAAFDLVAASLASHALTVGTVGGLTIGMMTRTARGHTGRPLQAGPVETISYVLVQLAAVTRVFVPMLAPSLYLDAVVVSGMLWSLAFLLFAIMYWPILSRPRIDGRSG